MSTNHSFANRWSRAIEEHGYTSLPTLLLRKRKALKITVSEMYVILSLESFRWDKRNPWPSMESIAQRAQLSVRTTRARISSLEAKGYIKRIYRTGTSSSYDLDPLVVRLDKIATSSLPPSKKLPPSADKMLRPPRQKTSAKEYPLKQNALKDPNIKNGGLESAKEILDKYRLKSNDFGNGE